MNWLERESGYGKARARRAGSWKMARRKQERALTGICTLSSRIWHAASALPTTKAVLGTVPA